MTLQAQNILMDWCSNQSQKKQHALAVAIQDAIDHGEDINKDTAEEIIRVVEAVV